MSPKDLEHFDYITETFEIDSEASSTDVGDAFTFYYVNNILKPLYSLSDESIEEGLEVQGANDKGIDFANEDDNIFYIAQCKYRGTNSNISAADISQFGDLYKQLFEPETAETANRAVKEFLLTVRKNQRSKPVRMDFIYSRNFTESMNNQIRVQIESIYSVAQEKDLPRPEINFYGIKELRELHGQVHGDGTLDPPALFGLPKFFNIIDIEEPNTKGHAHFQMKDILRTDRDTIILPVKATSLTALYRQRGNQIFSANIRYFQGMNAVNKEIKDTIDNHPSDFFIYNNGISAICSRYELSKRNKNITIFNIQIINGAQTTQSLFNAQLDGTSMSGIYVLLKLVATTDVDIRYKIIKSSNRQTAIKDSDFRSNDVIQQFLASKFESYKYYGDDPPQKLKYLNKRQQKPRGFKSINLEELTKLKAAVHLGPHISSAGTGLYDKDSDGTYLKIFGKDGGEIETYSKAEVEEIVAIVIAWFRIESLRKKIIKEEYPPRSESRNSNKYRALIAQPHITWFYFSLIDKLYSENKNSIIKNIINGSVFSSVENNFIDDWFMYVQGKISDVLDSNPDLIWRNWQRTNDLSTRPLKNKINNASDREFPIVSNILS